MSRKPSFSGNIELLKAINDATKNQYTIKAGNNVKFDYDANSQTNTISVLETPVFDDVIINNKSVLTDLNNKVDKVNNVSFADNEINLNLGTINGVQVPTLEHQAVNKKYVDETVNNVYDEIQKMDFVNFKGEYSNMKTYDYGALVVSKGVFYVSNKELNNDPLTNTNSWLKVNVGGTTPPAKDRYWFNVRFTYDKSVKSFKIVAWFYKNDKYEPYDLTDVNTRLAINNILIGDIGNPGDIKFYNSVTPKFTNNANKTNVFIELTRNDLGTAITKRGVFITFKLSALFKSRSHYKTYTLFLDDSISSIPAFDDTWELII